MARWGDEYRAEELGRTVFLVGAPTKELLLERIKGDEQVGGIGYRTWGAGHTGQYFCPVRGTRWRESPIKP